jgi:hypothetical protein
MFAYISKHWRGQPLIDIETVINLISSTTTATWLTIRCEISDIEYALGVKIAEKGSTCKVGCTGATHDVVFRLFGQRRPSNRIISALNGWPEFDTVNASPSPSREKVHYIVAGADRYSLHW